MDRNEPKTERDLRELEAELRSFGTPYQSPEPDERYWANFRVRVMDRIDAKQIPAKRSIAAIISEWFAVSSLRPLSVGMAVIVLALGSYFYVIQTPKEPVVATVTTAEQLGSTSMTASPSVSTQQAPTTTAPEITASPKNLAIVPVKKAPAASIKHPSAGSEDLASIDRSIGDLSHFDETVSLSNADDPVDYSSLSEPELESVLSAVTTISVERN